MTKVRVHVLPILLAVACGGAVTTSVDSSKDVGTLTPTEQSQLCADITKYYQSAFSSTSVQKIVCQSSISSSGQGSPTCKADFEACMAKAPTTPINVQLNCESFATQLEKCSGMTVSAMTTCIQQYTDAFSGLVSQMPYCDAASYLKANAAAINKLSNECINAMSKCGVGFGTSSNEPPPDGPPDGG